MTPSSLDAPAAMQAILATFADERYARTLDELTTYEATHGQSFQSLALRAECLSRLGRHEQELDLYGRLEEFAGRPSSILVAKANCLRRLNRTDEAIDTLFEAIAENPADGEPWWLLADLKSRPFEDTEVQRIQSLLSEPRAASNVAALHFAFAKALEERNDIAGAMAHYRNGNSLRLAGNAVPPRGIRPKIDRAIATFTQDFFAERADWGLKGFRPIFIIGQHRAGSTLIEQILDCHPDVEGLGELPLIPQLVRRIATATHAGGGDLFDRIASLDEATVRSYAEEYRDALRDYRRSDRPRIVDKLPGNWSNVGLIALLFPDCAIVDARRHPMACGLSNFQQNFSQSAPYTRDLTLFAAHYREYLRMIEHVDAVLPNRVIRIVNERLVADLEPTVRHLLEKASLSFDPRCLDFHANRRNVRTPSANQVRRPIDPAMSRRWHAYRPYLTDLESALGDALERWDDPR